MYLSTTTSLLSVSNHFSTVGTPHGFFSDLLSLFLHLDQHLVNLTSQYDDWIYLIFFLIVFCETGLVVTPLLSGDSLLFTAGLLSAVGSINIHALFLLLTIVAIAGNTVNYAVGLYIGGKPSVPTHDFSSSNIWIVIHRFFERHGDKSIVVARFVPSVRTIAPSVAGASGMSYGRF